MHKMYKPLKQTFIFKKKKKKITISGPQNSGPSEFTKGRGKRKAGKKQNKRKRRQ